MKRYKFSPQELAIIRKKFVKRTVIILSTASLIGISISLWNDPSNWIISIVALLLLAGGATFSISRSLKQNMAVWESICIEMGEDYITRSQLNIPQLHLNRQEIVSIDEMAGGLCIRTSNKSRTIMIPNNLADSDYQEIKSKLDSWTPIQPKSQGATIQNGLVVVVLIIGFGILILSSSLWLVLVTGILMTGYYAYIYWTATQAEGVDPQLKRTLRLGFLFPAFITIIKVIASTAF